MVNMVSYNYNKENQSVSAQVLRSVGIPGLYWRFIFIGGTVYRRSDIDPLLAIRNGWSRDGYEDLVRHTDTEQGVGSNWIATTENLTGMDERYGTYAFEIDLHWYQGVVVNPAYLALTGHRNPHAEQNEIAVWGTLPGHQITAVWAPVRPKPTALGPVWADSYERYSVASYIRARDSGLVAHPPRI